MAESFSEKLKYETFRFKQLLDDPQPGLHTWVLAYFEQAKKLRDLLDEQLEDGHA